MKTGEALLVLVIVAMVGATFGYVFSPFLTEIGQALTALAEALR